jgi:ABC-type polysaccharide/polyol phosphate export permease
LRKVLFAEVRTLLRYRVLIGSLVSRELKARYRGSVLGFLWSFVNPLLLLFTYWLVFTYMLVPGRSKNVDPYFVFMFCGILPWTWFQGSIMEASGGLISGGNLIKKVLFPAEVLPVVTVFANLVQLLLALPVLLLVLVWKDHLRPSALLLPIPLLVQLVLTLGVSLIVSALTVHFRDIQNILSHLLHIWFFASPVIYPYPDSGLLHTILRLNPMTHILVSYQEILFYGSFHHFRGLLGSALFALLTFSLGAFLFDRLRDTFAEEV